MEVWKLRANQSDYRNSLCVTEVSKKHLPYCYKRETGNAVRNRCISNICPNNIKEKCEFKHEMIITGCGG